MMKIAILMSFVVGFSGGYWLANYHHPQPEAAQTELKVSRPDFLPQPSSVPSISNDSPIFPDKTLTPGATEPNATEQTVCNVGYTKAVRDVPLPERKQVFREYGIAYQNAGQYEVDHLVSLELGGSNDIKNLWPEKYCPVGQHPPDCIGARDKDVVETTLHREICAGHVTLQQAQQIITTDWYAYYKQIKGTQ